MSTDRQSLLSVILPALQRRAKLKKRGTHLFIDEKYKIAQKKQTQTKNTDGY
jgi:hypothetical protein